jgi:hypothetical protein
MAFIPIDEPSEVQGGFTPLDTNKEGLSFSDFVGQIRDRSAEALKGTRGGTLVPATETFARGLVNMGTGLTSAAGAGIFGPLSGDTMEDTVSRVKEAMERTSIDPFSPQSKKFDEYISHILEQGAEGTGKIFSAEETGMAGRNPTKDTLEAEAFTRTTGEAVFNTIAYLTGILGPIKGLGKLAKGKEAPPTNPMERFIDSQKSSGLSREELAGIYEAGEQQRIPFERPDLVENKIQKVGEYPSTEGETPFSQSKLADFSGMDEAQAGIERQGQLTLLPKENSFDPYPLADRPSLDEQGRQSELPLEKTPYDTAFDKPPFMRNAEDIMWIRDWEQKAAKAEGLYPKDGIIEMNSGFNPKATIEALKPLLDSVTFRKLVEHFDNGDLAPATLVSIKEHLGKDEMGALMRIYGYMMRLDEPTVRSIQNSLTDVEAKLANSKYPEQWKEYFEDKKERLIEKLGQTQFGRKERGGFTYKKPESIQSIFEKAESYDDFKERIKTDLKGGVTLADPVVKAMWDKNKNDSRPIVESKAAEKLADVAKGIPGLRSVVKNFLTDTKPYNDVRLKFYDEKDISWDVANPLSRANYFSGQQVATITNNSLVKWGTDLVQGALKRAEVSFVRAINGEGKIVPGQLKEARTDDGAMTVWKEKLNKDEQIAINKVLWKNEGEKYLTTGELKDQGFNDNQIKAYSQMVKVKQDLFKQYNDIRVEHGLEPIKERPGHWPSIREGDWQVSFRDKASGDMLHVEYLPSRYHAKAFARTLAGKFDDIGVDINNLYGQRSNLETMINAQDLTLRLLDKNDPRREGIKTLFSDYIKENIRGFTKHTLQKAGVPGEKGRQLSVSELENTENMASAYEAYIRSLTKIIEMEKIKPEVMNMQFDKNLHASQPLARSFVNEYWKHSQGLNEVYGKAFGEMIDKFAEKLGFGKSAVDWSVRKAKAFTYVTALGIHNVRYLLSGQIQPVQFMPTLLQAFWVDGLESPWKSLTKAQLQVFKPEGEMASAREYAIREKIIFPQQLADIEFKAPNESIRSKVWDMGTGQAEMKWVEKTSRYHAFMMASQYLLDNKAVLKEKFGIADNKQIFDMASNMTRFAMTDYARYERPMLYGKLGRLGDLVSTFNTFSHNYYGQLHYYASLAKDKGTIKAYTPIAQSLAIQTALGGMLGFIGVNTADFLIKKINSMSDENYPTMSELILTSKWMPDIFKFGVSSLTGIDMHNAFAAGDLIPNRGMNDFPAIYRPYETIKSGVDLAKGLATNQLTEQTVAKFEKEWLSTSTQVFSEAAHSINGMVRDPERNMAGSVQRTPLPDGVIGKIQGIVSNKDWLARLLSSRTVDEAKTLANSSVLRGDTAENKGMLDSLMDQAQTRVSKSKSIDDLMIQAAKIGVSPDSFVKTLTTRLQNEQIDAVARQHGINPHTMRQILLYNKSREVQPER